MIATLEQLGWKPCFQEALDALGRSELEAARIATEHKGLYRLYSAHGELSARLSGNMFARVEAGESRPVVGDWVAVLVRREAREAMGLRGRFKGGILGYRSACGALPLPRLRP